MSWQNVSKYGDDRLLSEISGEEVSKRIGEIISSNPIINGSIKPSDGNSRQTTKTLSNLKNAIKKQIRNLYRSNLSVGGNKSWRNFKNAVMKLITNFLIHENYKFYLQDEKINNNYVVEKGGVWFLPTYFCLKVIKYSDELLVEFFSNAVRDFHEKEFYCETTTNMRHPCLTIDVDSDNRIFRVLICSNTSYYGINEPITLIKDSTDYEQFVALDWKVKASRKMLDIKGSEAKRFGITKDELNRIEGKMLLKN